jgi:hypothetical protein
MSKKGQSISINAIIIAALALLVLVLIALIFTGKIGFFRVQSGQCENNGGTCKAACDSGAGETQTSLYKCDNANYVCCLLPTSK